MKCIICQGNTSHHFNKTFNDYSLTEVEYNICSSCGFAYSKTHFEMGADEWSCINAAYHSDSFSREDNPYNRNQRYFNQSLMLYLLSRNKIVSDGRWLDWGSGIGSLSRQLRENFGIELHSFDKFTIPQFSAIEQSNLVSRGYDLVVNTAVFEHVRDRETLDEIESYVCVDGCLAIHTLVRGEIPADPDWMYLLPVHCAFHTNRSMGILMQQWGYTCSIYNEHAKMWVWFKRDAREVERRVAKLNALLGWNYLHFKAGFMDYWP